MDSEKKKKLGDHVLARLGSIEAQYRRGNLSIDDLNKVVKTLKNAKIDEESMKKIGEKIRDILNGERDHAVPENTASAELRVLTGVLQTAVQSILAAAILSTTATWTREYRFRVESGAGGTKIEFDSRETVSTVPKVISMRIKLSFMFQCIVHITDFLLSSS